MCRILESLLDVRHSDLPYHSSSSSGELRSISLEDLLLRPHHHSSTTTTACSSIRDAPTEIERGNHSRPKIVEPERNFGRETCTHIVLLQVFTNVNERA